MVRNRIRAQNARAAIAKRRAEALLAEHLTEAQLAEFRQSRHFHVETADGARRYRIDYGYAGNIRLVKIDGEAPRSKQGRALRQGARFCCHAYHPDGAIPTADHMLAQKLMLETDEAQFLRLANVSSPRSGSAAAGPQAARVHGYLV